MYIFIYVNFFLNSNSMEQSPLREANSRSASQKISRLLWNPKVTYNFHNSPLLVPILTQHHRPCLLHVLLIASSISHAISMHVIALF
jgi:hypothetical protein